MLESYVMRYELYFKTLLCEKELMWSEQESVPVYAPAVQA